MEEPIPKKTGFKGLIDRLRRAVLRFAHNTNWHGFGPAVQSIGVARLVWSVIFVGCAAVCVWQLVGSIQKYLSNPTSTSYTLDYGSLDFPAVTLTYFANMPGSNTTSSGRKKRSIEEWPGPLQFSDFVDSDTVVGGITFEEFLITVMDYYIHNKWEMEANRKRQLDFFHAISRDPKTSESPSIRDISRQPNKQDGNGIEAATESQTESFAVEAQTEQRAIETSTVGFMASLVETVTRWIDTPRIRAKRGNNCGVPLPGASDPLFVSVTYSNTYQGGSIATVTCKPGTFLVLQSGLAPKCWNSWSYTPVCMGNCTGFTVSSPVHVSYSNSFPYVSGTVATFSCISSAYVMTPTTAVSTCTWNGTWDSTTVPTCALFCATMNIGGNNPATIVYNPTTTPYYVATTATATCATDYTLTGATNPFTCTSMGTFAIWQPNSTVPYCAAPCAGINSTYATSAVTYSDTTAPYSSGSTVAITCVSGSQLGSNGGTATCVNGNWTTMPVCLQVCSTLAISGSNAATIAYSPATTPYYPTTTATITCATDYVLTGATNPFTCTSMGTFAIWSPDSTVAYCAAPCTHINSTVGTSSVTFSDASSPYSSGSTMTVTCASGYQLGNNGGAATCTNGNWTTMPVCLAICPALTVVGPPLEVSYSTASPYLFGTIANFTCVSPYVSVPSGTAFTCLYDGTWSSSSQPTCQLACDTVNIGSDPTTYSSAYSDPTVSMPGSTANITCNTGYTLYGLSSFTCVFQTTFAFWSPNTTNTWCAAPCLAMTFDTTTQSTATIVYSQTPHVDSSRVTVTCASNYVMSGTTPAICTNGTWNQPAPICLAPCSPLTIPNSLSIVYSDSASMKSYNSTATVTCAAGHVMRGNDTVTCLNAVWSAQTFPGCYASCPSITLNPGNPIEYILGGVLQSNPDFIVNTTAVLSCNFPLQLVDPTAMTIYSNMNISLTCLSNGTWDKVIPECLAVCPNFAINYANVTFINSLNQNGDVAVAECTNDYLLYGPSQFTCYANATETAWIPNYSACYCAAPCVDMTLNSQTTSHSVVTYTETTTIATVAYHRDSSTVTVHCAADYTLSGITPALCTNGSWNELAPLCLAPCSALTILNSDTITYSDTNTLKLHNSTATVACLSGFVMRGNSTLTCYDDVWTTQTFPGCYASCPAITITNGNPTSYLINGVYQANPDEIVNTTAVVSCPSPYSLVNPTTLNDYANANTTLTCLINGTWDNVIPECRYVCTKFTIANANISYPNPTVLDGDTANIVCINNHVLYGPSTYTCNAAMGAGIWDQNYNLSYCAPACVDMTLDAQTIAQSTVTYSESTVANFTNLHKDLSHISVVCATHYVLIGQSPILCLNGTWQYSAPMCYAPCPTMSILNADPIDYSDAAMLHNSTATVTCQLGFVMRGNTTLTCNNGIWTNQVFPSCHASCPPIVLIPGNPTSYSLDGIYQANPDIIVNTTATLSCPSPLNLVDLVSKTTFVNANTTLNCLLNGTWDNPIPACTSTCQPFTISNANVTYPHAAVLDGDTANISCFSSFVLYGPSSYTCNATSASGFWNENYGNSYCAPGCVDIVFDSQTISNSTATYSLTTVVNATNLHQDSSTMTIVCATNYVLVGNEVLTCYNGTWNYPTPMCLAPCSTLTILNSDVVYSTTGMIHNSTATVNCQTGYVMRGNTTLTCNNGDWIYQTFPACYASCSALILTPGNPTSYLINGVYQTTPDQIVNTTASVSCPSPYRLIDPVTVTDYPNANTTLNCLINGTWDKTVPECRYGCNQFTIANANVTFTHSSVMDGDTANIVCASSFLLYGPTTYSCIAATADGIWNQNYNNTYCAPGCVDIIFDSQTLANSTQTYSQTVVVNSTSLHLDSSTMTLVCATNYQIIGPPVVKCTNGSWNYPPPVCLAPCSNISVLNSNQIVYSSSGMMHNSTATVSCQSGFVLRGNSTLTCNNGVWNTQSWPSCYATCGSIKIPNGYAQYRLSGVVQSTPDQIVNTTVALSCMPNYNLVDNITFLVYTNLTLTCQANGTWDQTVPYCAPGLCTAFTILNANVTTPTVAIFNGDVATVTCLNDYNLYGPSQYTCISNESTPIHWAPNYTNTFCAVPCVDIAPNLQTFNNSQIVYTETTSVSGVGKHRDLSSVTITCAPAYFFTGQSATLTCLNGTWNYPVPSCLKNCNYTPNAAVANSQMSSYSNPTYYSHNSTATLTCDTSPSYYLLLGAPQSGPHFQCNDGTWQLIGGSPVCMAPCGNFSVNDSLTITYSAATHQHNSTVSVTCKGSYSLIGDNPLTCNNGSWDYNEMPQCLPMCPSFSIPNSYGNLYTLAKTWTSKGNTYSNITNMTSTQIVTNTVAYVSCLPGYTMIDPVSRTVYTGAVKNLTCLSNFTWNAEIPRCSKFCTNFTVANANVTFPSASVQTATPKIIGGDNATVACTNNYNLYGSAVYQCSGGIWSPNPSLAYCAPPCLDLALDSQTAANSIANYSQTIVISGTRKHMDLSTVSVVCSPAYTFSGQSAVMTCQNGTWNYPPPVCLKNCNSTPNVNVLNSVVPPNYTDPIYFRHNSTATMWCNSTPVYTLSGVSAAGPHYVCLNGVWNQTGGTPVCLAPCTAINIGNMNFVTYSSPNFIHNSTAVVVCNSTYVMRGNATLTCINGVWITQMFPSCFAACNPINITNGQVEYQFLSSNLTTTDYMENTTALLSCNVGYAMTGSPASMVGPTMINTCQKDHTWNYTIPQCLPACTNITTINRAILRYDDPNYFVMGTNVNISCPAGWVLTGPTVMTCGGVTPGVWQPNGTFCHQPCATIAPAVPMGITTYSDTVTGGSLYVWNSTVAITCPTNYILTGPTFFTCVDTAVWFSSQSGKFNSTNITRCHAPCDPTLTGAGLNVSIVFSDPNYIHKSNATFSCPPYYLLSGDGSQQCLNGNWTGNVAPTCLAHCTAINIVNMNLVTYSNPNFIHNSTAAVVCNATYVMRGNATLTCINGVWTTQMFPSCFAACSPINITNGQVEYQFLGQNLTTTDYMENTTALLSCDVNYTMTGSPASMVGPTMINTCQKDHTWNYTIPQCLPACTNITTINRAILRYDDPNYFVMGTNVNISCPAGWVLTGPTVMTCGSVTPGVWQPNGTFCHQPCATIAPAVPMGITTYSDTVTGGSLYVWNSTVAITCPTNYILTGPTFFTCVDTAVWYSTESAPCNPTLTGAGSNISITFSDSNNIHKSNATFSCPPFFLLSGDKSQQCLDGNWTGNVAPTCLAPCASINIGNMNLVNYSSLNFIHNSTAVVVCNSTYVMRGNATLTCINGVWTTQMFPSCFAACSPINITNGQVEYQFVSSNLTTTDYMENSTALLSCDVNYTMTGSPASMVGPTMINTCQKDHTWNYTIPQCLPACTNITTINRAILRYDDPNYFVMGTSVNISCPAGWVLTGPTVMTCGSVTPGVWQPNGTFCHQPCATITPAVPMGITTYSDTVTGGSLYVWNSTVAITCPTNYILTGPTFFTCVDTAVWFSTQFSTFNSSNITRCHAPCNSNLTGAGLNVSIVFSDPNYIHLSNATFFCPPFFVLFGDQSQQCLDGNWTVKVPPTCLKSCPPISLAYTTVSLNGNATVSTTPIPTYTQIYLSCPLNFMLTNVASGTPGIANFSCQDQQYLVAGSLTVITTLPVCTAKCPAWNLTNGNVTFMNQYRLDTTTVWFQCANNYALDDPSCAPNCTTIRPSYSNCTNGTWSSWPKCYRTCPAISVIQPTINFFNYSHENLIEGSNVKFHCINDSAGHTYVLNGTGTLTCLPSGAWDNYIPVCIIQCPPINLVVVSVAVGITYTQAGQQLDRTPTTEADYACPSGYIVFNYVKSICQNDSTWLPAPAADGRFPYCLQMPAAVQTILDQMGNVTGAALATAQASAISYLIATLTSDELANISYPMNELIVGCLMNEQVCLSSDWQRDLDPSLGACYRYNNVKPSRFKIAKPGRNLGLQLLLNTQQNEYLGTTQNAGFLVIIHEPGATVFADASGYKVPPGYDTNLQMTYSGTTHQPSPYGHCIKDKTGASVFYYPTDYSVEGCLRSCLQFITIKTCGCADIKSPMPSSATVCDVSKSECVATVAATTTSDQLSSSCSCPPPCYEPTYTVTISQSVWPTRVDPVLNNFPLCYNLTNVTFSQHYNIGVTDTQFETCYQSFRDNYGRLNVYFNTLNQELLITSPSYSIWNLLTDVGSSLGLFLGGSFITIGELIHFCLLAILAICVNPPDHTKRQGEDTDEAENLEDGELTAAQIAEITGIMMAIKEAQMQNEMLAESSSEEEIEYYDDDEESPNPPVSAV